MIVKTDCETNGSSAALVSGYFWRMCPVSLIGLHTHVSPVVVAGHALVSPPLRHHGQLLVPDHLPGQRDQQ